MPTQSFNLSDEQAEFIRKSITAGHFHSADDMVRTGLRLLELAETDDRLREARLEVLVQEGFDAIERGDFIELDEKSIGPFFDELMAKSRRSKSA